MPQAAVCPELRQYQQLAGGELGDADEEALLEHLEHCDPCAQKLSTLAERDTLVELIRKGQTPGDGAADGVIGRLVERLSKLRPVAAEQTTPPAPALAPVAPLIFACPTCGKSLKVKVELAGKKVKCPNCQQVVCAPAASSGGKEQGRQAVPSAGARNVSPEPGNRLDASTVDGEKSLSAITASSAAQSQPAGDKKHYDFLAPPQAPDELGRLGPYRVLAVLGTGGMGVVFRAEDPQLARLVALKAMLPGFMTSENARQRFLREAQAAAAIKHDHIVSIYQVGEDRAVLYLAMELLDGEPLDARLQREGKLPVTEVLRIGRQIALGLAAAHKRGLIHRDIKPANIWLEAETGRVKILDFGLARTTGDQAQLTQQGAIVGTPAYMAPEQGKGKGVDYRCDLFSLGCVLYRMATGAAPFSGTDVISTLMAVATENPRSPRELEPTLPRALSELIVRLLAKDAANRPASAQAVAVTLDQIAQEVARPEPVKQRRRWWPVAAVAASFLALLAAGVVFFMQTPDGVVRIEIDDPEIKLAVQGHSAIITNADKEPITIKPGKHGLTITRGDFQFNTASFELTKRGKTTLKITWLAGQKMVVMQDGTVIGEKPAPPVSVASEPLAPRYKNSLGMEFVLVPKGKSWLGGGSGRPGDKEVEIVHDFYLGKYDVTQEEWEKVTGLTPSYFSRTGSGKDLVKDIADAELKRFPVENVSWDDAQIFVESLNKREKEAGWVYRLPTEVEWEYACRGGPLSDKLESAYDFYLDKPTNTLLPDQANIKETGLQRTCKVGSYKPNRLGIYDMHGNVLQHFGNSSHMVFGGGCWSGLASGCAATGRWGGGPRFRGDGLGCRLARVPSPEPPKAIPPAPAAANSLGMRFVHLPKGTFYMGGGGKAGKKASDQRGFRDRRLHGHPGTMGRSPSASPISVASG